MAAVGTAGYRTFRPIPQVCVQPLTGRVRSIRLCPATGRTNGGGESQGKPEQRSEGLISRFISHAL